MTVKKTIYLFPFMLLLMTSSYLMGQTVDKEESAEAIKVKTVKGKVFSEDGKGIPAVNIMVKDSEEISASTDEMGYFTLTVPENTVLTFSIEGEGNQYVKIGKDSIIPVMVGEKTNRMFTWFWCCSTHPDSLHCAKDKEMLKAKHGEEERYVRKRK